MYVCNIGTVPNIRWHKIANISQGLIGESIVSVLTRNTVEITAVCSKCVIVNAPEANS